jgi:hypothetical protein
LTLPPCKSNRSSSTIATLAIAVTVLATATVATAFRATVATAMAATKGVDNSRCEAYPKKVGLIQLNYNPHMPLNFKYDLNKDIENYRIIAQAKYKGGNSRVLDLFAKRFGDHLTDHNLSQFIKGLIDYNKIDLEQKLADFQRQWQLVEQEFIRRANAIFGYDLSLNNITVYLTTNDRCGYFFTGNYFFLRALSKRPKMIIMHELIHFYTLYVFKDELEKLNDKKSYDIKESLTELLNLEFSDLIEGPEDGYEQHQKLRQLVRQCWLKEKNIRKLFEVLVKNDE